MASASFDTLKAADALTSAGINEEHAKAIVSTVRDAVTEGVATKADIARLETKIAGLETKIEATANRILVAVIAVGGLIVAALKLL